MVNIKIMHFISGIQSGGVEQMLINYTSEINHNFDDIEQFIVYQHDPDAVCYRKIIRSGNKCFKISDKKKKPISNLIDTFQLIKKLKPDIVHAHMNLLNFIPLFFALILGVKVRICHSHIAHNNINSKILEIIFKKLNILFSNSLFACGQKAGEYMFGKRNFEVIYNSIEIEKFKFNYLARKKIRRELGLSDDEVLLGNIGRLTEQKNQIFLLRILQNLSSLKKKYKLIILGEGILKKTLLDYVDRLELNDYVIVHTPVGNINDFYAAMDVFVLPSLYEGFPVSIIEAQVSGLPCIVSDEIDNTTRENTNVYFESLLDEQYWINRLQSLDIHASRYIELCKFNRYNVKISYYYLYKLYRNLLEMEG